MTGFRSSMAVMAPGGIPASSTPGRGEVSPSRSRSSSIVIPPWVTAVTGPGAPQVGQERQQPGRCLPR